ncbi:UTRA domain-containing protein [Nocardia elegans]|uniref:UTRA domain-containing protein n=1 Tax=Nocardia elegans TaxID=300029 RepID=A0ABW6TE23_9NOCA
MNSCGPKEFTSPWRGSGAVRCSATRAEAQLPDECTNAPLLTMRRVAFDDSGRPIEMGGHVYRASRHFFGTTVKFPAVEGRPDGVSA